jgi:hypothetical protein
MEEALDKLRLTHHVISVQSFDLSCPHHVAGFYLFERSLHPIETLDAL